MLMLALESSAKACSAALFEDENMLALSIQTSGLTHSRTLLPMAEDMLRNTDKKPEDLGLVAVSRGPGSFTGLRIGLAEAKGLKADFDFYNMVDNALFTVEDGKPVRLTEDRAISLPELEKELIASQEPWILLGDGAQLCYNTLDRDKIALFMAPEPLRVQNARGVGLAAMDREPVSANDLLPVYLRLSQAERQRLEKLQNT